MGIYQCLNSHAGVVIFKPRSTRTVSSKIMLIENQLACQKLLFNLFFYRMKDNSIG